MVLDVGVHKDEVINRCEGTNLNKNESILCPAVKSETVLKIQKQTMM